MKPEEWKNIDGHPNFQVSSLGRVKEIGLANDIIPPHISKGYYWVTLNKQNVLLHRIIAKAFVLNPDDHFSVKFKDGNIKNVFPHNLVWFNRNYGRKRKKIKRVTIKCGGCKKKFKVDLCKSKGRKYCSDKCRCKYTHKKKVILFPLNDKKKKPKTFLCINDASDYLNCNPCCISRALSNPRYSTRGHKVKYAKQ